MDTIRTAKIEIVDYIAICGCGWEHYSPLLKWIKADTRNHLKKCDHSGEGVYIDRCIENEIDDYFPRTVITKKATPAKR